MARSGSLRGGGMESHAYFALQTHIPKVHKAFLPIMYVCWAIQDPNIKSAI